MAIKTKGATLRGGERYLAAISIFGRERAQAVATRALARMAKAVRFRTRSAYLAGQVLDRITGELFDSIEIFTTKPEEWIRIGTPLPQGMPLHFGWPAHNMPGRPWLFPAIDDVFPDFPTIFEEELTNEELDAT